MCLVSTLRKGNVVPTHNIRPHHEDVWGVEVLASQSMILEIGGGEWSAFHLGCFNHSERVPGTHCIGGWINVPHENFVMSYLYTRRPPAM
jgi:hypothetical protein